MIYMMNNAASSHLVSCFSSRRGVPKCVFHAPGSLIKCRGILVVNPPGIPDFFRIRETTRCQKQVMHKQPERFSEFPTEASNMEMMRQNTPELDSEFSSSEFPVSSIEMISYFNTGP